MKPLYHIVRPRPDKRATLAWACLEAVGVTLCWLLIVAGVYAVSVLFAPAVW